MVTKSTDFKRVCLPKELKKSPDIAWPTIILLISCLMIQAIFHYGYIYHSWNYWLCLVVWSITVYCLFTPMHDAAHSSIATHKGGYHWLNDCVGRLAALPYLASFHAFQRVHLTHHKYTNVEELDPAYYSHSIPHFFEENAICQAILSDWRPIILPLKWLTVPHYLIYFYVSRAMYQYQTWSQIIEVVMNFTVCNGFSFYLYFVHGNSYMFDTFYRAQMVAMFWLSIGFDYLPHRNIHTTEPYTATSMVSLKSLKESQLKQDDCSVQSIETPMLNTIAEKEECDPWHLQLMGVLCLNQNYHTVHHLYPSIPWYRYTLVWHVYSEYFKCCGTEVLPLFPFYRDEVDTHIKKED